MFFAGLSGCLWLHAIARNFMQGRAKIFFDKGFRSTKSVSQGNRDHRRLATDARSLVQSTG
jgi:hypothetical protein